MQDNPRRLLLRVGVKLMFLAAIGAAIYVLFSSTEQQRQQERPAPLHIHLTDLSPATFQRIPWQGGNLILLRRNEALREQLENQHQQLQDPQTPPEAGEIYIAFDHGTGLGCPLQWVAPANSIADAPLQPWPGGLHDSCDGSWYDAAGRVFKGQQATRNLESPAYQLVGELLEIGPNGDNPAPAK